MPRPHACRLPLLTALLALSAGLAQAEAPMVTDDAGTLEAGGHKVELAWGRDGGLRMGDLALGWGASENLELGLALGRARDLDTQPATRARAWGLSLKWVPLETVGQGRLGVRLDYGVAHVDGGDRDRALQATVLYSQPLGQTATLHANLGHVWHHESGGAKPHAAFTALGLDVPLPGGRPLALVGDLYREGTGPVGRQLGLRWTVSEGLKLSAAVGRQDGRTQYTTVGAWEF